MDEQMHHRERKFLSMQYIRVNCAGKRSLHVSRNHIPLIKDNPFLDVWADDMISFTLN